MNRSNEHTLNSMVHMLSKAIISITTLLLILTTASVNAETNRKDYKDEVKDAWVDGKIETAYALNRYLNPFDIDTKISGNVAHLSGTVDTAVERDLAEQIALSFDAITNVQNNLKISSGAERKSKDGQKHSRARSFAQAVEDATITAAVKTKLLANTNVGGLSVNVDTKNNVVTLSGNTDSGAEKELIEQIAGNTEDVKEVKSKITVKK